MRIEFVVWFNFIVGFKFSDMLLNNHHHYRHRHQPIKGCSFVSVPGDLAKGSRIQTKDKMEQQTSISAQSVVVSQMSLA